MSKGGRKKLMFELRQVSSRISIRIIISMRLTAFSYLLPQHLKLS